MLMARDRRRLTRVRPKMHLLTITPLVLTTTGGIAISDKLIDKIDNDV